MLPRGRVGRFSRNAFCEGTVLWRVGVDGRGGSEEKVGMRETHSFLEGYYLGGQFLR